MPIKTALLFLLVLTLSACQTPQKLDYNIGQQSYTFTDTQRQRPLNVEVWYPTLDSLQVTPPSPKDIFKKIQSIPNASIKQGSFPLLLLSHGTGGNRFSLTWMIEPLVKSGYVVVSLGHYGNTTFHKLPREFVKWWERAIDMQFVLDKILEEPKLVKHIDQSKIGGIGFSLGGYTNIALAGGLVDRTYHPNDKEEKKRELPPEFPQTEEIIDFDQDSLILASYQQYKNQVKDERFKAFFVMAPAIGFGFHKPEQTQTITAPIMIVASKGDSNTPIAYNALQYHQLIPSSELHLIHEKADHYVFLNEATKFGKTVAPAITIDASEINRQQIHQEVSTLAIDFFQEHLNND